MTPELLVAILGAGGLSALIPQIVSGIKGWRDGSHDREKVKNVNALAQRDQAIRQRDLADRKRRIVAEHAARVRRLAIERGIPADDLPRWPSSESKDEPDT